MEAPVRQKKVVFGSCVNVVELGIYGTYQEKTDMAEILVLAAVACNESNLLISRCVPWQAEVMMVCEVTNLDI